MAGELPSGSHSLTGYYYGARHTHIMMHSQTTLDHRADSVAHVGFALRSFRMHRSRRYVVRRTNRRLRPPPPAGRVEQQ
eukprot:5212829-Pyramimonas_sp.AAC.1